MYAQIADTLVQDVRDVYIAHAKNAILMRKNIEGLVP
jgi:hypothetical protein